jgi:hypothetical protein
VGGAFVEEAVAEEAGVTSSALRVEDPELRPPPRRPEPAPGDSHLRPLADNIPTQADPRPPGELEPEAGCLGDGRGQARGQAGGLEDDEERLRSASEGGQSMETIRDPSARPGLGIRAAGKIDEEEIDRTPPEERPGDRQALVE